LSAGALPQTPLGELTALPRPLSWILGAYFEGEGKGRERRVGEGTKGLEGGRGAGRIGSPN